MNVQLFWNLLSKVETSTPATAPNFDTKEKLSKLFTENETLKTLYPSIDANVLKTLDEVSEVLKGEDAKKRDIQLHKLNKDLLTKTYVFAEKLTALDLAYYVILYEWMSKLNDKERFTFCNITRWFNLVQNQKSILNIQPVIAISLVPPPVEKKEEKKPAAEKKEGAVEQPKKEKRQAPPAAPEPPMDISRFEIKVGKIVECKKHEAADSLYVEKIDLGEAEGPRTIVSGLVKFIPLDQMLNRKVLVLCNLKPANLKGIKSFGMVLCASNSDHTQVEFVEPPADAVIGERVVFEKFPGDYDKVLKPATFDAVIGDLQTNADKIAVFKGDLSKTSAGPCTVKSIAGVPIK
ncbi:hypothetical protein DICPUDRAFT_98810 [Dictyostelium purpureum]|uniref:tRNA-binding domain-containing protein n=1 Tax=Dictyostelium purpureum TaxID=5786 RepID=F0ZTP0_DICPU|nr:uncharacterized protein DICPUDRAFT_98810 [Dictyostelium purpureum]EGC32685.1 hypothetical protein DICPUDRAFT_98810 [Dictyostelium purpureum]|eukprot:XP_003290788.1 hypothetical protein DICPUDRAFT_98810 [Dictyostelium purpureum]